jgi:hypothetical protein
MAIQAATASGRDGGGGGAGTREGAVEARPRQRTGGGLVEACTDRGQAALRRDRGLHRHPLRAPLLARRRLRLLRPLRVQHPVLLHGLPQLCRLLGLVI